MTNKTITGTAMAWLRESSGPEVLVGDRLHELAIFGAGYNMASLGYTKVGPVTMTVEIPDEQALVENKVTSLKAEATKLRADTEAKLTEIERKINTLLAITFDAESSEHVERSRQAGDDAEWERRSAEDR